VHQTLQRLTRDGLVRVEARRGITLTPDGRRLAEEAVRRQRLSERWLVEMLGVDWPEARQAARTMEPAISDGIADRLDALLGHPMVVARPSREAADSTSGEPVVIAPLDHIEAGSVVVLERIVEDVEYGPDLLRYLDSQGLRPGARLTVASVEPWAHTVTLRRGEEQFVLGTRVAAQLRVGTLGWSSDVRVSGR
jgi:DtxR family Mn-dependent transcriptional regulator